MLRRFSFAREHDTMLAPMPVASASAQFSRSLLLGILLVVLFLSTQSDLAANQQARATLHARQRAAAAQASRRSGSVAASPGDNADSGSDRGGSSGSDSPFSSEPFAQTLKEKIILDLSRANERLSEQIKRQKIRTMLLAQALREVAPNNETVMKLVHDVQRGHARANVPTASGGASTPSHVAHDNGNSITNNDGVEEPTTTGGGGSGAALLRGQASGSPSSVNE